MIRMSSNVMSKIQAVKDYMQVKVRRLEIRPESMIQIESRGLLTWVCLPGPMTLVPLGYIRIKAHDRSRSILHSNNEVAM
jgi:hypothetical protein